MFSSMSWDKLERASWAENGWRTSDRQYRESHDQFTSGLSVHQDWQKMHLWCGFSGYGFRVETRLSWCPQPWYPVWVICQWFPPVNPPTTTTTSSRSACTPRLQSPLDAPHESLWMGSFRLALIPHCLCGVIRSTQESPEDNYKRLD